MCDCEPLRCFVPAGAGRGEMSDTLELELPCGGDGN